MSTNADTANPETSALKGRRSTTRTPQPATATAPDTALSADMIAPAPAPAAPLMAAIEAANPLLLLDPANMPVVRQATGYVSEATLGEHYVLAEQDASEQITPPGCTTPIVRVLWHKGNHVRKDAYALWQRRAAATIPVDGGATA